MKSFLKEFNGVVKLTSLSVEFFLGKLSLG